MCKPTLLIGHGEFGREVLRRLLRKTAPRGSLAWAQTPAGLSEHWLRDLALLHLPRTDGANSADGTHGRAPAPLAAGDGDGRADFLRDLYRQIRTVEHRPGAAERALGDAAVAAAAFLRRPELQAQRPDRLPGLDVFVIAHLDGPAAVATLDNLTRAVLARLTEDNPVWRVSQPTKRTLHCIEVLDVDNYRAADGAPLRQAVRRSMEGWKARLEQRAPALDRAWLLDGRALDSHRDRKSRFDEITLFLEFLLFAGMRADEGLKALYQQDGPDQPIAAAFGVRLLERSPALLCRIAAARYGAGWTRWLRDGDGAAAHSAGRVRAALAPLLAGGLDPVVADEDALAVRWRAGVAALAEELLALPEPAEPDWPARAAARFTAGAGRLQRELPQAGLDRLAALRDAHLAEGGQQLAAAITADLHDELTPVPLAAVLAELDAAIARASRPPVAADGAQTGARTGARTGATPAVATDDAADPPTLRRTTAVHRRYLEVHSLWLAGLGRGLGAFWPLLAGLLALGAAPFAAEFIDLSVLLAGPDPAARRAFADWLAPLNQPLFVTLALWLLLWLGLRLLVQPPIVGALHRLQDFWLDPARGRLTDAIRGDCNRLVGLLTGVRATIGAALAADLLRVLTGLRERLARRDRELAWLGAQLEEFQRMQGLAPGGLRLDPPEDGAHRLLLAPDDLTRIMQRQGAERARFAARLAAMPEPFADWQQPRLDRFLDLFGFVDQLSAPYLEQVQSDAIGDADGPEWSRRREALTAFLRQPGLAPGFRCDADRRTSSEQRCAVLPADWRGQPGIAALLDQAGFRAESLRTGADPARVYLLVYELGIGLDALEPPA